MSWLKEGGLAPLRPGTLKSNLPEGHVREVWILDGDITVYYSLQAALRRVMHTAIVSLMPTIWRCAPKGLMPSGRIQG